MRKDYQLFIFDWNGTLSSGKVAGGEVSSGFITELFPGVFETLKTLQERGKSLAIATAASRSEMQRELKAHGLEQMFSYVMTNTEGPVKPDPFAILEILQRSDFSPQQTLMIGDTQRDMTMAKQAGVDALGVSYGLRSGEALRLAGALGVIDSISALIPWLQKN